jgi:hypothetical protein
VFEAKITEKKSYSEWYDDKCLTTDCPREKESDLQNLSISID